MYAGKTASSAARWLVEHGQARPRSGVVFLPGRARDAAGLGPCCGQTQFGCNDGQLRRARRISLKHDVPNARVPEPRKRITTFARDYYKSLGLVSAGGEAVELVSIDYYHTVDAQVGLVH